MASILVPCKQHCKKETQDFAYAESATESRFQFEITFDGDKCNIITAHRPSVQRQANNPNRFKTYLATNATMSPVYLYRLADGEYAAAPEAMYIHGHFPGSYYDFSAPVQMTAEEGGKVFTATNVYIGGNADAEGNPLSYVFSGCWAEGDAPQSYALRQSTGAPSTAMCTTRTALHTPPPRPCRNRSIRGRQRRRQL